MNQDTFELRYKRPTQREKGHHQIIFNQQYVGYFLRDMDLKGYMMWYVNWEEAPYEDEKFYEVKMFKDRKKMIEYIGNTLKRKSRTLLMMEE